MDGYGVRARPDGFSVVGDVKMELEAWRRATRDAGKLEQRSLGSLGHLTSRRNDARYQTSMSYTTQFYQNYWNSFMTLLHNILYVLILFLLFLSYQSRK